MGQELFGKLTDDVSYFFRLSDAYYAAASNEIQVAMAVSQRISGALSDALPDDPEVQSLVIDNYRARILDPEANTQEMLAYLEVMAAARARQLMAQ